MGENEFPIIEKDHKWKYRERKTCYKHKGEIWELLANIKTSDMFDSDSTHHIALLDDHHTKELQSAGWLFLIRRLYYINLLNTHQSSSSIRSLQKALNVISSTGSR